MVEQAVPPAPPATTAGTDFFEAPVVEHDSLLERIQPSRAPSPSFEGVRSRRGHDPESRSNEGYKLLEALRDKVSGMLLLTATPMQLHDFELYSMVELVEPGLFNGYGDFSASRSEIAAINRAVTALRSQQPVQGAIDEAAELLRRFSAPPRLSECLRGDRDDRLVVAEWLSRCHRLAAALVRNRKAEIGGFTSRVAHTVTITPTKDETELQKDLIAYIRDRYAAADPSKRTAVGLVLVTFQKMFCSSSQALAGALESRCARLQSERPWNSGARSSDDADLIEDELRLTELAADDVAAEVHTLTSLARRARAVADSKLVALEELVDGILLDNPMGKVLIFSQYLESIEMIRKRLSARHVVRSFHGWMSREEKDAAHDAFRHEAQVLVSSEAGGEGRNFQFCHIVINHDLPWNPMKIEQRIGRVDRIGQKHPVEIYNFALRGMLDARILDVLEQRILIFTETVGALDPILESFEQAISRIALGDEAHIADAFARLGADFDKEIRHAKALEELRRDFVLDWRSLQPEKAATILSQEPRASRDDLERFCDAAIARFPVGGIDRQSDGSLLVRVPGMLRQSRKDVEEGYRGSFHIDEALADERMSFFAMGHPLVESIIDNVGDPWWSAVGALESEEWQCDDVAVLVDYRLELYGARDSGCLISHLVCEDGVLPAVSVMLPREPGLKLQLPALPADLLSKLREASLAAARREAVAIFETFKREQAELVEQETGRVLRMFDSRAGLVDDRMQRNTRQIERLGDFGTVRQQQIRPALEGQIRADEARLAEIATDRQERLAALNTAMPEYTLKLLGATLILRPGGMEAMTS